MLLSLRAQVFAAIGLVSGCAVAPDTGGKTGLYDAIDADGDGETAATDCNDHDAEIHSNAAETCNLRDDNCNNEVDEGVRQVFFLDGDHDGYGTPDVTAEACEAPTGHVDNDADCDDTSDRAYPGGEEVCDGLDNDCNGEVDEIIGHWPDGDNDGYGVPTGGIPGCGPVPDGYATDPSDCDDGDATVHPGANEVCLDGKDNDCDGQRACLQATLTDTSGDACVVTWALTESGISDTSYPCAGCTFSFGSQATVVDLEGTGWPCDAAESEWRNFVVEGGELSNGDGAWVPDWTGVGAWTDDRLVFATGSYLSTIDGDARWVAYSGEVFAYEIATYYGYEGRPLSVDGEARVSPVRPDTAWAVLVELDVVLTDADRRLAAAAWLRAARAEHASVASFARFTLDLMALGAPPDLLMASAQAMADEVAHAQAAFGIASALSGERLGPGPLDTTGALDDASPQQLFLRLLREGCVDETVSAALAGAALAGTTSSTVAQALRVIAEDEGQHAVLAWKSARWMLTTRPALADTVRQVLAELAAEPPPARDARAGVPSVGVLASAERERVRARVLHDIVVPGLEGLLGDGLVS